MRAFSILSVVALLPVWPVGAWGQGSDELAVVRGAPEIMAVEEGATSYVRYGVASAAPGDLDFDGDVDLADFAEFQGHFTGPLFDGCLTNANCDPEDFCSNGDGNCLGPGRCSTRPESCTQDWDPVCGCNGRTYSNACYAHANGVNILRTGECLEGFCTTNGDCDVWEWCAEPIGTCTGYGVCQQRPGLCLAYWDPVCGCDGHTYSNYCYAWFNGVNIDYYGECVAANRCYTNAECALDEFCDKADGDCLGEGECTTRPTICTHHWDPVCGCDGVTYSNECYANANGQSILHTGECVPPPCLHNSQCQPEEFCAKVVGACDSAGACQERPEVCLAVWDPVCGCDGRTYSNWCYAARAGENVEYYGECTSTGECQDNSDCTEPGDYCAKPYGLCEASPGVCTERPEVCICLWDPVCGCDNKTYSNYCYAAMAGENVRYKGECDTSLNTCWSNNDCDDDGSPYTGYEPQYCHTPEGMCSTMGLCLNKPDACPPVAEPVCGCDGVTYANACYAAAAGTGVDHLGDCTAP